MTNYIDFLEEDRICDEKIKTLIEHAWNSEVKLPVVEKWLLNFTGEALGCPDRERLLAKASLTRFIYFSDSLVRQMLKSLYRDYFEAHHKSIIRSRYAIGDKARNDFSEIQRIYHEEELNRTLFVALGRASESGCHLLYPFRQENDLSPNRMIVAAELSDIFKKDVNKKIKRLVFFDDVTMTGDQGILYLKDTLKLIRSNRPDMELSMMVLFGTKQGMTKMNQALFFNGKAKCIFYIDDTYRAFSDDSKIYAEMRDFFAVSDFRRMCEHYGTKLYGTGNSLGYKNNQLVFSFSHNTPDNTLTIFWFNRPGVVWNAVFPRFEKADDSGDFL